MGIISSKNHGLIIQPIWGPNTSGAPAYFYTSVQQAINILQAAAPQTNIVVNIQYDYQFCNGAPLGSTDGAASQAVYYPQFSFTVTYSNIKTAISSNIKTGIMQTFYNNLPSGSTFGGNTYINYTVPIAKALGVFPSNQSYTSTSGGQVFVPDGYVGLNTSAFMPQADATRAMILETIHALGAIYSGAYASLFAYSAPGTPDPGHAQTNTYMSFDGGNTVAATYDINTGFDPTLFANGGPQDSVIAPYQDVFDLQISSSTMSTLSTVDVQMMNCMGFQ